MEKEQTEKSTNSKEMDLYKYIISEENIFLAIYSLKTYIFNPELLSKKDRERMLQLQDVFNEKEIVSMIKDVKKELVRVLNNEDEYFNIQVYFKPKKIDKNGTKVFRPIHTAPLVQLVAMVAMFHLLIYEIPTEKNKFKLIMSNYSRLLPSNFFGNRISNRPEELFKKWSEQYQKYTEKANNYFKTFHTTNEYQYELKLDLENFFPSIDPLMIYQYMLDWKPVTIKEHNLDTFKTILMKLLICKISNISNDISRIQYYGHDIGEEKCFTRGIAQGLPQSFFFGNICMIEISKIFQQKFPGESIYYVDDSYLYTNQSVNNENDFKKQLEEINSQIENKMSEYIKKAEKKLSDKDIKGSFLSFRSKMISDNKNFFGIHVHYDEKSTYSKISDAKNSEVFLKSLSREASQIGTDIFKSYSDEEDVILQKRSEALLEAINKELDRIGEEKNQEESKSYIEEQDINEKDLRKNENDGYEEKLHRYYKFFKYRTLKLKLKCEKETEEEIVRVLACNTKEELKQGESCYKLLENQVSEQEFFEMFKDDIWPLAVSFLITNENNKDKLNILRKYLNNIIKKVYDSEMKECSYLALMYHDFIENKEISFSVGIYDYLEYVTKKRMIQYANMNQKLLKGEFEGVRLLSLATNILESFYLCSEHFLKISKLVDANTQELRRMVLNAIYSRIFKIRLSDEFVLNSYDKRGIQYGALRSLIYIRNKYCNVDAFFQSGINLNDPENLRSIDYTIFEVLEEYRTFVQKPERIDKMILIHHYTCDVWKNGAKHLYFYTLHNQEHAVDLVKNIIKIVKSISFIKISNYDYYLLFIACYLHDISMVKIPSKNDFLLNDGEADKITCEVEEKLKKNDDLAYLKNTLIEVYQKIDGFYENAVRSHHAIDSATEIRNRSDLSFLEPSIREAVADVAESHMSDTRDIYYAKSDAKKRLLSYKFDKILLRFADLLDMSEYRVSRPILNHNIENMSELSAFHWVSHLLTEKYDLTVKYKPLVAKNKDKDFLSPGSITEEIHLIIYVRMSQMSKFKPSPKCKYTCLEKSKITADGFNLIFDKKEGCDSAECNFLCRWFTKKNNYLIQEMNALEAYLNRVPVAERYFNSKIIIEVKVCNETSLDEKQFEIIQKKIQ